MWGNLVLDLFGWLERSTVTTVVMLIKNVTEIIDWHTVQTESQLKYIQCQVPVFVKVCQVHRI